LSDNEIVKLENFPFLNRLGTLVVNNNRITRINPNLGGKKANILSTMTRGSLAQHLSCCLVTMRSWVQVLETASCRNAEKSCPFIICSAAHFSLGFCNAEFLPKLHSLVLTSNRLTNLAEIDPLASLPELQYLSLLDNTVTKQPDYRHYVIHKLKHLRLLDFKKVKKQVSNAI
jgi:Leucine-rich repeat (LRR) protein